MSNRKLLVINIAALGYDLLKNFDKLKFSEFNFQSATTQFPAVTCTAQATFRTATKPANHGMIANGLYFKPLSKIMFWEQSSNLIAGARIWDNFKKQGGKVGLICWQQSMGENADLILTPAPIHKHHGGMIMDCYCKPANLYRDLVSKLGKFKLHQYWGPLASAKVGRWIANATAEILNSQEFCPDLLLTYLPSLDYDLQRYGPDSKQAKNALSETLSQLETILQAAKKQNFEVLILGDYAIGNCSGKAIEPNSILKDAGLFATRKINKMIYPDFYQSQAFAMVDHEIAWIYTRDETATMQAKNALVRNPEIEKVYTKKELAEIGLDSQNAGDLLAVAQDGKWFTYRWWSDDQCAPDYVSHVDIHNKPGFDPCELFGQLFPPGVTQKTEKIAGSHGLADNSRLIAWATTIQSTNKPKSLIELAEFAKKYLDGAE